MASSTWVCAKDGLPVTHTYYGWRHALGGKTGAIPKHRRHRPVVVARAEYERLNDPATPLDEARAIAERWRAQQDAQRGQ